MTRVALQKGFSLLELLVVLAVLSILAALTVPFLQSSQSSSQLDSHSLAVTTIIRRAHQQAVSGYLDDAWGVYFDSNNSQVVLFKGDAFNSRDDSQDYYYDLPAIINISASFGSEISFELRSGLPSTQGIITLMNNNQQIHTITIEANGLVVHD